MENRGRHRSYWRSARIGVLAFVVFSCTPQPEPDPLRLTEPAPTVRRIVYSVEVLSGTGHVGNAFQRTVWLQGARSCTQEERNGAMWLVFRDSASAEEEVCVRVPWLDVRFRRPVAEESRSEGALQFMPGEKGLLGYACRKAIVRNGDFTGTAWYAPGLEISDPTAAVVSDPRIPGTILQLEREYGPRLGNHSVRYTVTELKEERAFPHMPAGAQLLPDGNGIVRWQVAQLDSLQTTIPPEQKDRFIGKWRPEDRDQRFEWKIERFGADVYTLTETRISGRKRTKLNRGIVHFYEEKLVVQEGEAFRLFSITSTGRLREEGGSSQAFRRK